ncbi:MAG: 2-oxoacid:ferredoxin oxidoreductase subunit beta, partial [Bacteroidota bacterium]|nr:2-oxoacid:ferredoxin oxidoreductase subunit beta [Bacteroidota bacterium]
KHGEKMIFGANNEKGIVFEKGRLKAVTIGQDGYTLDDILVHDAEEPTGWLQMLLCSMGLPELPVAFGVIRSVKAPVYDQVLVEQINEVKANSPIKCMDDLLNSGDTWEVK